MGEKLMIDNFHFTYLFEKKNAQLRIPMWFRVKILQSRTSKSKTPGERLYTILCLRKYCNTYYCAQMKRVATIENHGQIHVYIKKKKNLIPPIGFTC